MTLDQVMTALKARGRAHALPGMARYGIDTSNAFGVKVPELRKLAREIGRDHDLAEALWQTGAHDARLLASMVAEPKRFTRADAERWAAAFRSWDLCDQCCMNLFRRTPFAADLIEEWRARDEEFVKRAAFALIATLAVHDKKSGDGVFRAYLPVIETASDDERNYVRKAVNWALRQIGKRNRALNTAAIETAERIAARDSKVARWIAKDALRELTSAAAQSRLKA